MSDDFLALPPALRPVAARLAAAGANVARLAPGLRVAGGRIEVQQARSLLQDDQQRLRRPRYLVSGWAYRFTQFADGRRQIYDLILPGEGVGVCLQPRPLALTSVAALTRVELIDAETVLSKEPCADSELAQALKQIADLDERRMLDQVVRLGRMSAVERLAHLLLQLHDRLMVVGAVEAGGFRMPATQEVLADLLGLSTVHLNRTVQELRRQNLALIERGTVKLLDRAAIERLLPTTELEAARAIA